MKTSSIYELLKTQGLGVVGCDTDKDTITFECTTSEILVVSKALGAIFLLNEIILVDALTFKLRML